MESRAGGFRLLMLMIRLCDDSKSYLDRFALDDKITGPDLAHSVGSKRSETF